MPWMIVIHGVSNKMEPPEISGQILVWRGRTESPPDLKGMAQEVAGATSKASSRLMRNDGGHQGQPALRWL